MLPTQPQSHVNNKINNVNKKTLESCHMLNVQGLYPNSNKFKKDLIKDILDDNQSLFMAITESHLKEDIMSAEIDISNYQLYRCDRKKRKCGGVAIYIRSDLGSIEETKLSNDTCECIVVKAEAIRTIIITCYRPPDCSIELFNEIITFIDEYLITVDMNKYKILINGDFNFPFIDWKSTEIEEEDGSYIIRFGRTGSEQQQANRLLNIANKCFLTQVINQTTRGDNILDLCFFNAEENIKSIITSETNLSDHNLIEIKIEGTLLHQINRRTIERPSELISFMDLNFFDKKIDWKKINESISDVNWSQLLENAGNTSQFKILFDNTLLKICKDNIPMRRKNKLRSRFHKRRRTFMKKRTILVNRLKTETETRKIDVINENLNRIEREIMKSHEAEREYNENIAVKNIKCNSKYFFSYAARFSSSRASIGPFIDENGEIENNGKQMSEMLSKQYKKVFSSPKENINHISDDNYPELEDMSITYRHVEEAIDELKTNSAAGPDGIPAILLKKCKLAISRPIVVLWKKSFESSDIPAALKHATICPIHKGGNRTDPANYRPVSLTSHVIKIFERIIKKEIVKHLETNEIINENQHGFRSKRSTTTQLLEHFDSIMSSLCEGFNVDVIYLDFAKAFDKVDHGILLQKMHNIGIRGKIFRWIREFLKERTQSVIVKGNCSEPVKVISGVPQGTVLGPILFIIMANDLNNNCHHTCTSYFADDTRVVAKIEDEQNVENVQIDLNNIYDWALNNNMMFNETKFEMLRYGKNSEIIDNTSYLSSSGIEIKEKTDLRDLGVRMQNDASFEEHIARVEASGRKWCSWVLRTFKSREKDVMLTLWKQLILPRLEYCSPLWLPHKRKDLERLEGIQRSFTSKIHIVSEKDYHTRLTELDMYSIQRRFERFTIICVWKILQGLTVNVNDNIKASFNERTGLKCQIKIPKLKGGKANQTKYYESFSVRGPRLFNCMPSVIRDFAGRSVVKFKTILDKYLRLIDDKPLLAGYPNTGENSLLNRSPSTVTASATTTLPAISTNGSDDEEYVAEERQEDVAPQRP